MTTEAIKSTPGCHEKNLMKKTPDQLQTVIETSEFDRWLGLKVLSLDDQSLTLQMPFRPEIIGTPKVGRLHGGIVASLIDAAACYLLIAKLATRVTTANLVIDYLRPSHGDMLAVAKIVKTGKRICNVTVEVTGSDGRLSATGRATIVPLEVAIGDEDRMIRHSEREASEQAVPI